MGSEKCFERGMLGGRFCVVPRRGVTDDLYQECILFSCMSARIRLSRRGVCLTRPIVAQRLHEMQHFSLRDPLVLFRPLLLLWMIKRVISMLRISRRWFEGKGDVWRLLQDMSDGIDGRSWPEEQAVEVGSAPPGL